MSLSSRGLAILLVLVCVTSACSDQGPAARPEIPRKIVFVGDSLIYFNSGHCYHFEKLVASADPPLAIHAADLTSSGCSLKPLWESSAALNLGLDGTPTRKVQELIDSGEYDVIVLDTQILSNPGAPPGFDLDTQREYASKFAEAAKKAGSQAMLLMTWPLNPELGGIESVATFEDVDQWVSDMGKEWGVAVAPVALAWQRAIEEQPDLKLYADTDHPSVHGTYLSVNVVYATILGKSPEGLSYWPEDDGVTEEDAAFLQRIAWETVQEYQSQD